MTFTTHRFRPKSCAAILAVVALLLSQTQVGMAYEVRQQSDRILSVDEIVEKRVWVIKNTPQRKIRPASDSVNHAIIKSVITDYKTGLNDDKKDHISQHILKQSKKYGYDPLFLTALIITESSFNHRAKSKAGALGLMQIRPITGKAMASESNIRWRGKRTLFRPEKNIALGSFYLSKLFDRFGNMETALEAYNHGPTKTARYLRRGKKTKIYSGKVFAIYKQIKLAKLNL